MPPLASVKKGRAGADQPQLAHVRHIEQRRRGAALLVLGNDAAGIVHRHVVAGERRHARTVLEVPGVQRGVQRISGHEAFSKGNDETAFWSLGPSLSALPERLAQCRRGAALAPSVGRRVAPASLQ